MILEEHSSHFSWFDFKPQKYCNEIKGMQVLVIMVIVLFIYIFCFDKPYLNMKNLNVDEYIHTTSDM